ncbi:SPOR domain-containing protein [Xinfangfangia sp. D13-10-4-6]|nr:SPOR domain-containing protein [Pseudogemmobacter hezensis]
MLAGVAALALAGCEPGTGPFASSPSGAAASDAAAGKAAAQTRRSTRIVDRDVEAPQVFQVTEDALWDGRPSLGGVWVASPDATDPERVIMRNQANGKFVIGALFRRERDNPGPKLQISSDAAEALGLLAGAPGKLSVTALRREEAPEATPETPVLDSNEALAAAPAAAGAGAGVAAAVSTTALDTPAAGATADAKGKPAAAGAAATATAAAAAPDANAPKKTKRQLRREAREAEAAAKAQAKAQAAANAQAAAAAPSGQPAAAATAPAVAAIATTAPAAPASPAAKPAAPSGRSIQIGFFSQEANATRAQSQLSKAGVSAQVRKESSQGKDYWSVFTKGDAATLKKIKSAGFADAYMMK